MESKKGKKCKGTKTVLEAAGDNVEIGDAGKLSDNVRKTHKSRKRKARDLESNEAQHCKDETESENHVSDRVSSGKTNTDRLPKKKQKKARKDELNSETKEIKVNILSDIAKEDVSNQGLEKLKAKRKESKFVQKEKRPESTNDLSENLEIDKGDDSTETKHKRSNSLKNKRDSENEATEDIVTDEKMENTEPEENLMGAKSKHVKKRKSMNVAENEPEDESGKNLEINQDEKPTPKKKKKRKNQNIDKETEGEENKTVSNEGEETSEVEKKHITESKKSKKKKKQKSKETDQTSEATSDSEQKADKLASEYLHQWSNDRESWKFQKVRQVWLLKNMYSENKVSNEDFKVLLSYLDGMKGRSREVTVEQAEKIIEEDGDKDEIDQVKIERARQIVQLLT